MNTVVFDDIEKLESDLWEAADNLRTNWKLTFGDYFMSVLGVILLRHAANRFDAATRQIAADSSEMAWSWGLGIPPEACLPQQQPVQSEERRNTWAVSTSETPAPERRLSGAALRDRRCRRPARRRGQDRSERRHPFGYTRTKTGLRGHVKIA